MKLIKRTTVSLNSAKDAGGPRANKNDFLSYRIRGCQICDAVAVDKAKIAWYILYQELRKRTGINVSAEAAKRHMYNIDYVESNHILNFAFRQLIDDIDAGRYVLKV